MFNLLGPLTTAALALYACLASNLFSEANQWLPRIVDAIFAALTTIVSISLVVGLDSMIQFKLFDGKMMSSAVVFCTNPTPPSPHAFIVCSSASFCAGVALHFLGTMGLPPDAVAVGIHVLFAKLSGCNFSSAVGLTAFVGKGWSDDSWAQPLHFLVATWLLGHALLFALAHVAAVPRRRARLYLTRRQWKALMTDAVVAGADATGGGTTVADADAADADAATTRPRAGIRSTSERRERLRELFARYDTSGDGRIDATEFRVTLRALAGVDVPLADCEATVRARAFWRLWTPPPVLFHAHAHRHVTHPAARASRACTPSRRRMYACVHAHPMHMHAQVRAFDGDGNGTLSFGEFCEAVACGGDGGGDGEGGSDGGYLPFWRDTKRRRSALLRVGALRAFRQPSERPSERLGEEEKKSR